MMDYSCYFTDEEFLGIIDNIDELDSYIDFVQMTGKTDFFLVEEKVYEPSIALSRMEAVGQCRYCEGGTINKFDIKPYIFSLLQIAKERKEMLKLYDLPSYFQSCFWGNRYDGVRYTIFNRIQDLGGGRKERNIEEIIKDAEDILENNI